MSLGTDALKVGREPERLRICNDSLKQQICKDQLKNASVRCNVSHKISKRPLRSPQRSRTLEEDTADRIGLQFTQNERKG